MSSLKSGASVSDQVNNAVFTSSDERYCLKLSAILPQTDSVCFCRPSLIYKKHALTVFEYFIRSLSYFSVCFFRSSFNSKPVCIKQYYSTLRILELLLQLKI